MTVRSNGGLNQMRTGVRIFSIIFLLFGGNICLLLKTSILEHPLQDAPGHYLMNAFKFGFMLGFPMVITVLVCTLAIIILLLIKTI